MKKILIAFSLMLITVYAVAAPVSQQIILDQIGYKINDPKWFMIANPQVGQNSGTSYIPGANVQLRKVSDDSTVMIIPLTSFGGGAVNAQSGDIVWQGDFSTYTTAGSYYIYDPTNNKQSYNFDIGDSIYNGILQASTKSYYYQRCGEAIDAAHGGAWTHAVCHQQELTAHLYDHTLGGDQGVGTAKDVTGGWHDAGDYRKYVTFTFTTLWDLMHAYDWNPSKFGDATGIPESGNGMPDILDEVKWELDWLLKMQKSDGSLYSGNFVTTNGSNMGIGDPSLENTTYFYANYSTAATATGAMAFALGSRLIAPFNPSYANTLKNAAVNAWGFLAAHTTNIQYDKTDFSNADANWDAPTEAQGRVAAAAELFALTGDVQYSAYVDAHYNDPATTSGGWHQPIINGYFETGASNIIQRGLVSYVLAPGATASVVSAINNSLNTGIQNQAYGQRATDPYKAYMYDGHYVWGSNQIKAEWGNMAIWGVKCNVNAGLSSAYNNAGEEYLHYFHGRNPLSWCFVSHSDLYGADKPITSFFHSWFSDGTPYKFNPAPGYLSGGPNANYINDTANSGGTSVYPPAGEPIQKSYRDWDVAWPDCSWEVTENGIYYQSRYVFLAAWFAGSAVPTATPTYTITSGGPTLTYTYTYTPTATYTNTATSTPTPSFILFNSCDTLTYNGTWTGGNSTRTIDTTTSAAITQGTGALKVVINTVAAWQADMLELNNFTPSNFTGVYSLTMDVYIPAGSAPWGASDAWHSMRLDADSAVSQKYSRQIAADQNLSTGMNHLTFTFNYSLDGGSTTDPNTAPMTTADLLSKFTFIINSQTGGTGSIFIDNMKLAMGPLSTDTPTGTPTAVATNTQTATYTIVPTNTFTATQSATPVLISTDTFTATDTMTPGGPTPTDTQISPACACGKKFGINTPGSLSMDDSGYMDGNGWYLSENAVVSQLNMNVDVTSGGNIRMAIYSDNGGAPGNLIVESAPQVAVFGWNVVPVTATTLSPGVYWIMMQSEAGVEITYDAGMDGQEAYVSMTFGSFPSVIPGGSLDKIVFSMYADYCPVVCSAPTATPTSIPACVCSAEFGMTYIGPAPSGNNTGYIAANDYLMSENGTATSASVYVQTASGGRVILSLYSNDATWGTNMPKLLLAQTQPYTVTAGAWNTIPLPQTSMTIGTIYWLAIQMESDVTIARDAGNTGDELYYQTPFGAFPAILPYALHADSNSLWSMHINYCPATCATPTFTNTPAYTSTFTYTATVAATDTNTNTNTVVATATSTNTPSPGVCLLDNCEDNDNVNLFGGYWFSYASGNGATVAPNTKTGGLFTMTAGGSPVSPAYAAHITGNVGITLPDYPSAGMGTQLNPMAGPAPQGTGQVTDISSCTGIRFYAKGDGNAYLVKCPYTDAGDNSLTGFNDWLYTFTAPTTWTLIDAPFSLFTNQTWGTPCTLTTALSHAKNFEFQTNFYAVGIVAGTVASYSLWIDDITLYGCATCPQPPTATPTVNGPTSTPTQTSTMPAATVTSTATSVATSTFTSAATNTSTATVNGVTDTGTSTPVAINTGTFTYTPTFTYTQTYTNTATYTVTAAATLTFTATPVATSDKLSVLAVISYPNPYFHQKSGNLRLQYFATRNFTQFDFVMYTQGLRLIHEIVYQNSYSAGTKNTEIPYSTFANIANGTYYYLIKLKDSDGNEAKSKIGKLIVLK